MKKGQRFWSNANGLIEVVDARRRVHTGGAYMLVRDEQGATIKQWLGHRLIPLDDDQWAAIRRISSEHYMLKQYVIDQFRQGYSPKTVGNKLQGLVDQLLHNRGE